MSDLNSDDKADVAEIYQQVFKHPPKARTSIKDMVKEIQFHYEYIIMNIPQSVYWKDRNGTYMGCNKSCATMLGLNDPAEICGLTDYDLADKLGWPIEIADEVHEDDVLVIETGNSLLNNQEDAFTDADGETVYQLTGKIPFQNEVMNITGVLGISTNITELKNTQHELEKAKEKAEAANKAKKEFIESMSHDLRTPLSGMVGMTEVMLMTPEKNIKHEYIQDVHVSSKRLESLFNQILDYISSEDPKHLGEQEPFALQAMFDDLKALFKPTETFTGVPINYTVSKTVPGVTLGYGSAISRIVLNLLSNATKFTESGNIDVNADYVALDDERGMLKLSVADTGIGIPDTAKGKIFERFGRVSPSFEGDKPGAGLGLNIVKRNIEEMGGTIHFVSEEGKGSTFICEVPLSLPKGDIPDNLSQYVSKKDVLVAPSVSTAKQETINTHGNVTTGEKHILIVEDNLLAAKVATILVTKMGYGVDHVTSGEEALEKAASTDYDFVFMDIGLPGIDGFETTKRLRESHCTMPIVALTGHANLKTEGSGLTDLITKPIDSDKAQMIFAKYLEQTTDEQAPVDDGIINITDAASRFDGNRELATSILKEFVDDIPARIEKLTSLMQAESKGGLLSEMHSIKGAASYCGVTRLQEAIVVTYDQVQRADSINDAKDAIDKLMEELQLIREEFEKRFID